MHGSTEGYRAQFRTDEPRVPRCGPDGDGTHLGSILRQRCVMPEALMPADSRRRNDPMRVVCVARILIFPLRRKRIPSVVRSTAAEQITIAVVHRYERDAYHHEGKRQSKLLFLVETVYQQAPSFHRQHQPARVGRCRCAAVDLYRQGIPAVPARCPGAYYRSLPCAKSIRACLNNQHSRVGPQRCGC